MPRRTAALAAVAIVLLTAMVGYPASGSAGTPRVGDAPRRAAAGATAGDAGAASSEAAAQPGFRSPQYERRIFAGRRSSVDLSPVTMGRERPNVIVLMMDDMRDDDLQFMPNVARLIRDQGVRFTNMFSPHPLCCPARASFFSGLYTHNHQVWSHKKPYGFRVFDDRQTLAVWLHRGGGYDTKFVGKYLNGYGRTRRMDGSSSLRYRPPGWTDWRPAVDNARKTQLKHLQGGTYRYFDTTLSDNGVLEPHQGRYQTLLFSDVVQDMVRDGARSPRPFFIEAAFAAPHVGYPREDDDPKPFHRSDGWRQTWQNPARPKYVRGRFDHRITSIPPIVGGEDFADKPVFMRSIPPLIPEEQEAILEDYRQRVEAISIVDDEVANIVETLERTGELDNTYLMFTSDNGFFLGEHRRRQGKILAYDASLRVPLVMRGPGIPAGESRTDPFLMVDFAPTILDAAGVRPRPGLDGVSMLDVAREGDRGWRRPIFTESGPRDLTEETLVRITPVEREHGPSSLRFSQGVRTGRYLYVEHASRDKELYDMRRDPDQSVNVVNRPEYQRVRRVLAAERDPRRSSRGPEGSSPLPRRLWTTNPVPPVEFRPAP